jgi:hypothetical protein
MIGRSTGVAVAGLALLAPSMRAAAEPAKPKIEVRAYVNDTCVIADEPYFIPETAGPQGPDAPKFLPLIGLVVGKLAELFINHELQNSATHIKTNAARKDTHYAVRRQMNLYRVTFDPAPSLDINARLGCMTIVAAAAFKPDPADCTAEYRPKELSRDGLGLPQGQWKSSRTDQSVENQLKRGNICVLGKASAVYESRFEFSKDGTAYRLRDAGYVIDTLLTSQAKGATRTTIYTLKITDPSATDQEEVLSSAWVNIGSVAAGARSDGGKADASPWLRVPPLSVEARRKFDEGTRSHQEVQGEIDALKRARTRNERLLAGLDARIAAAPPDVAAGLKQERLRIAVQDQEQAAELDARNAEYQDLPRAPIEYMPVTIEVAVTESESENKARLALADIIGKTSDTVASSVGGSATALLSKSVNPGDLDLDADEPDGAQAEPRDRQTAAYVKARDRYFDALVAAQTHASAADGGDSQRALSSAKRNYNAARTSLGLEEIK